MSEYCENIVIVTGPPGEREAFKALVSGPVSPFDFNSIIPMPKDFEPNESNTVLCGDTRCWRDHDSVGLLARYGAARTLDWCLSNWGTMYGCDPDVVFEESDQALRYEFETGNGPARGIYTFLRSRFPEVDITWFWNVPDIQQGGYLGRDDIRMGGSCDGETSMTGFSLNATEAAHGAPPLLAARLLDPFDSDDVVAKKVREFAALVRFYRSQGRCLALALVETEPEGCESLPNAPGDIEQHGAARTNPQSGFAGSPQ